MSAHAGRAPDANAWTPGTNAGLGSDDRGPAAALAEDLARRCLEVHGALHMPALLALVAEALEAAALAAPTAPLDRDVRSVLASDAIERIEIRGDAVRVTSDGDVLLIAATRRRIDGTDVTLGCAGARGACETVTLEDELGRAAWRRLVPAAVAEGSLADAMRFAHRAGARPTETGEWTAWRALNDGDRREALLCWPSDLPPPPRQVRRANLLFAAAGDDDRAALAALLRGWAGMTPDTCADPAQDRVVERDAAARLLIRAGPGAGKTQLVGRRLMAVARTRSAAQCHGVSFTRAASAELRARVTSLGGDEFELGTLHALAHRLVRGFDRETSARASRHTFDATLVRATQLLRSDRTDVAEWIATRAHLVIDEAQDVIGPRLDFVTALIQRLSPGCGVTVLADPAQAIYGEADDDRLDLWCERAGFDTDELTRNHRMENPRLRTFARDARARIAAAQRDGDADILSAVRADLDAALQGMQPKRAPAAVGASQLVLFGSGHAMAAYAQRLPRSIAYVTHGGRDGADAARLAPAWIAALAPEIDGRRPSALAEIVSGLDDRIAVPDAQTVERALRPAVRAGVYRMEALAAALDRGHLPPLLGPPGALKLSTIHGAKGLEADRVRVVLPERTESERDGDDVPEDGVAVTPLAEARLLYVAATRARLSLELERERGRMGRTPSGRYHRRDGDAVWIGVEPRDAQDCRPPPGRDGGWLPARSGDTATLKRDGNEWTIVGQTDEGRDTVLGTLGAAFSRDCWTVVRRTHGDRAVPPRRVYGEVLRRTASVSLEGRVVAVPVLTGFVRMFPFGGD